MKLLISLFALIVFSESALALTYADILGTWSGTRTEYTGGRIYHEPTVLRFTQFLAGGFKGTSRIVVPGAGVVTGTGYYYPNGKVKGFSKFRGRTIAVTQGTWTVAGTKIVEHLKVQALSGNYRSIGTLDFIGSHLFLDGKSAGVRILGELRR